MLTIAQITDLHITASDDVEAPNRSVDRLRQVLDSIHRLQPRPVAILATGDLADNAALAEYRALQSELTSVEPPIYFAMGNHDARAPFLEVFAGSCAPTDENGFVQYAIDFDDLKVVVCDTLNDGFHDGGFCELRAGWLARTLDAAPDTPTLVVMHHPPVQSGVRWMDPDPGSAWIARAQAVLTGRDQVQGVICGHLHRAFTTRFAGHPLMAAPATSVQLTLNLSPIDLRTPDGREILVSEPPGYLLHMWDEGRLTSHVAVAGNFPSAATYQRPFLDG